MLASVPLLRKPSLLAAALLLTISLPAGPLFGQNSPALHLLATSSRPANVPEGYVVTPFGYFHPSCVQTLAEGETLLADGRVRHTDGTAAEKAPVCSYPRYARDGSPATANPALKTKVSPEVDGWVENANVATSEAYSALFADWTVPPSPASDDGQVLFYFPGLEDINDPNTSILQPVLQWAGGQWAVANWNCCLSNIVTESPLINVSPGDLILGTITGNCRRGTLSCPTWTIFSFDLSNGESTTLNHTPSEGQIFNWAFGGVMEPYYVVQCSDYPPNHHLSFDVTIFNKNLKPVVRPKWGSGFDDTVTPQCNYGVKTAPYDVKVYY